MPQTPARSSDPSSILHRPSSPALPPTRRRLLRPVARWSALLVAAALLWARWPWPRGAAFAPAASPFVAASSGVALRAVSLLALPGLLVLVIVLFRRRWFCRYACPLGLLQDVCARRRAKASRWSRWPRIGQWLALATLAGACAGYPLFLWLDPLAIFGAFGGTFHGAWAWPATGATLAALALPLVLILSRLTPHLWCARLCPTGGTQELLNDLARRVRLRRGGTGAPPARPAHPTAPSFSRRALIASTTGAAVGVVGALGTSRSAAAALPVVRPPGAAEPGRFEGLCIRCGNCARACPSRVIRPDLGGGGWAGLLAPVLRFDDDYCRRDCNRCGQECPTGAITPLPLPDKERRAIGLARVDLDTCRLADAQECTACIRQCPYQAVRIESTDGGFSTIPVVDALRCNGCGACEAACPVRPVRSIRVQAARGSQRVLS